MPTSTECISNPDEDSHDTTVADQVQPPSSQAGACSSSSEQLAAASSSTPTNGDRESCPPLLTKEVSQMPPTLQPEAERSGGRTGQTLVGDTMTPASAGVTDEQAPDGISGHSDSRGQDSTCVDTSEDTQELLFGEDSVDDLAPPELTAMHSVDDAEDECSASSPPALAANGPGGEHVGGRDDLTTPPLLEAPESPLPPAMSPQMNCLAPTTPPPPPHSNTSLSSSHFSLPDTTGLAEVEKDSCLKEEKRTSDKDIEASKDEVSESDTAAAYEAQDKKDEFDSAKEAEARSPSEMRPHLEPEDNHFLPSDAASPNKPSSPPVLEEALPIRSTMDLNSQSLDMKETHNTDNNTDDSKSVSIEASADALSESENICQKSSDGAPEFGPPKQDPVSNALNPGTSSSDVKTETQYPVVSSSSMSADRPSLADRQQHMSHLEEEKQSLGEDSKSHQQMLSKQLQHHGGFQDNASSQSPATFPQRPPHTDDHMQMMVQSHHQLASQQQQSHTSHMPPPLHMRQDGDQPTSSMGSDQAALMNPTVGRTSDPYDVMASQHQQHMIQQQCMQQQQQQSPYGMPPPMASGYSNHPPMVCPTMHGQEIPPMMSPGTLPEGDTSRSPEQKKGKGKGTPKGPSKPRNRRKKGMQPEEDGSGPPPGLACPPPMHAPGALNAMGPPTLQSQPTSMPPPRQPMLSYMPYAANPTGSNAPPPPQGGSYGPNAPPYPGIYSTGPGVPGQQAPTFPNMQQPPPHMQTGPPGPTMMGAATTSGPPYMPPGSGYPIPSRPPAYQVSLRCTVSLVYLLVSQLECLGKGHIAIKK